MCGKRLKDWKTMPMPRRTRLTSTPSVVTSYAADDDPPGVDRLQEVDAAEQRRLAGARRADQADDLVLGHGQVDPAQHLGLPERLVQALDDERLAHATTPAAWRRRRSRATR